MWHARHPASLGGAFARWDRSHLHQFELGDPTRLATPFESWDATDQTDDRQTKLSRLQLGERFVYVFDLGDGWTHLCTVDAQRVDPLESLGLTPGLPLPYFGWGDLGDQYRRRWEHDDGESDPPPDPELADLPPLRPWWDPQERWGKE